MFFCYPISVSATDVLIVMIKDKTINKTINIKEEDIVHALGGLSFESMHCINRANEAFRNVIKDYEFCIKFFY